MTADGASMAPHGTTRQERRGRINEHPRRLARRIGRHSDRAQPEVSVVHNPSIPTIRVPVRENNGRKGTDDAVVPQGATVPRGGLPWPNRERPSGSCRGGEPPSGPLNAPCPSVSAPVSRMNLDYLRPYAPGHAGRSPVAPP